MTRQSATSFTIAAQLNLRLHATICDSMKIFFFFSILHKLYCEVAKELKRQDDETKFSGILYGSDQLRDLQQAHFPSRELSVFTEELRRELPQTKVSTNYLRRWEQRHGICFSTVLSTDRRYSKLPRELGLRLAMVAIRLCDRLLDQIRPEVIVAEGVNDLLSHALYYAARQRGIPYLITYACPAPERIAIYSNPDNHWERVEEIFWDLKSRALTAKQRSSATALIVEYREKHLLPSYLSAGYNRLYGGNELHSLWSLVRRHWLDPAHKLDPSYAGSVPEIIGRKFSRIFRAGVNATQYASLPKQAERFVFFPLQMEPECSTLVFAPFHANQFSLIECISKSLPVDHWLYIKEHPAMQGRRPLSYYWAICALPNVKLLSPKVSSHVLIHNASAIVTITSSVGWEALMHGKPVIVMGHVWFDAFGPVHKVRATADLPAALRKAIFDSRYDEDLLLKFVTAFLEGTYSGQIEHPDYTPGVLSAQNTKAIASAIRQHLHWLDTPSRKLATIGPALRSFSQSETIPAEGRSRSAGRG